MRDFRSSHGDFDVLPDAGYGHYAHMVEEELHQRGHRTMVLDGDNARHGLCGDLGYELLVEPDDWFPCR